MTKKPSTNNSHSFEQQNTILRAQLKSLTRDNEALAAENTRLAQEAAESAVALATTLAKIDKLELKIARLVEMIKLANTRYFGSKSEKVQPEQLSLFNDTELDLDPTISEPELTHEKVRSVKPRKHGGKRCIDTSKLERVVVEHTIKDPSCPQCGSEMAEMKVEVSEVIKLVPAHLVVEEHRRHVYKCKPCCLSHEVGK